MKYLIRNDIDSQMEHIKEKLGKIHPSHWKCSLHSTQSENNNEHSPGVVTTCFLSLESPSDFVSTSLDAEKNKGRYMSGIQFLSIHFKHIQCKSITRYIV